MKAQYQVRYKKEQLSKVKRYGLVASIIALLSIPLFYYLDYSELQIEGSWPWRLLGLSGAVFFLLSRGLFSSKNMLWCYAISLLSYLLMMLGLSIQVFSDPSYGQVQYFAVTTGVLTVWMIVTLIARGVERYVMWGMLAALLAYFIFLLLDHTVPKGYIATVLVVGVFTFLLLRHQSRQSREKAFYLYELEDRERRIEQQREALEEANANLVGFNYAITHDLRAPLRRIQSFLQLVERRLDPEAGSEVQEFFGHIRNDASKIMEIIEGLLLLSQLGKSAMQCTCTDLSEQARMVWSEIAPESDVDFALKPLGEAYVDTNLVWHVFTNLFSNAVKYSRKEEQARVEVGSYEADGQRVVYVQDNGAGFPAQYAAELGKPFKRLHTAYEFEGTGIGLAIVKQVVELHGGSFWAAGEEGKGATFYCSFPIAPPSGQIE
ncbi:MAG: hypothetical protein GVY26_12700 [Bacteroidetes bacterium]|jgi:signal transduction histidine kinase|nr:hypothetical protein [Bacteroidota bacterium]